MEMVYASLLLHSAKQKINAENITKVLQAAGITAEESKVRAMVAALEGVNIEEALSKATAMPAAAPAEAKAEKKEEAKEEDEAKKAEQAVEGLAGLFG